ncbi:hypothetical protein BVC80_233g44 [Macleaya cordata]|uniref:Uncharacterized protein n=1 Tax=Macleaya cordata TaxID=56857 RepID=A0A200RAZ2_MACCD|nr:hypothetical protein BVC80_233g44 [Macleaya cordata]
MARVIQKFALRFAASCDAEAFMDVMKVKPSHLGIIQQDSLTDRVEIGLSKTDLQPEVSSQSEFVSSNGPYYRAEEKLSIVNADTTYSPQMAPALNYNHEQIRFSQEPLIGHDGFRGVLPPSFTALLTNCSAEAEQVQPMESEEIDLKSQITVFF